DLSKNPLSTLSWQLFQHLQISELRLESVVFECGCDIRWVQLWQQRGDAALHTQQLYCKNGASKIRLHNMYIHNCDLPEISVSHSSLLVMEGDNVTVSCNGSGAPLPEVDWTVSDLHSINTHLSNVYWPNIHSINLTLFNISREDNNFQLTCIAENVVGMSNSSIQLNVQFPPLIVRLAEPEKRHDTCIEFTVRGYPHPRLRWFYKKKEIVENDYIRTELDFYQDYLEGCLIFKNPTHLNNGNYTLEASNRLGTVTKSVNGRFLFAPDIEDVVEIVPPSDGDAGRPDEDTFGVSIAVGLAGFACVLLLVLFVLINKYGRRSKFGMKGKSTPTDRRTVFACVSGVGVVDQ
ncbi:NT-3 growth factor receptor-like, partial [Gymnodraco acuticeps]|uniref:NT-3 growth factor receptor-like n=1 Tax=Gymnodraco acuticeps TaxID=8218 RepID=A0A6P8VSE9_GYMAC